MILLDWNEKLRIQGDNDSYLPHDIRIESDWTENAEIPKFYLHGRVESEVFTFNFRF